MQRRIFFFFLFASSFFIFIELNKKQHMKAADVHEQHIPNESEKRIFFLLNPKDGKQKL